MKITKTLVAAVAALSVSSSFAFADVNEDYIKAFGMSNYVRSGLSELKLNDAEFAKFVEGMNAVRKGEKLSDVEKILPKAYEYLSARVDANIAAAAEKAEAESAEFFKNLEKNNKNVVKTPSGLYFEIIEKGNGKTPAENSEVIINYEGKLINGTVFDSSKLHGKPAQFNLSNVIPGFREGLQKVSKNGKIRLYIPAKLGYGSQPTGGIPVNSTLIFDVEMIDVDPMGSASAVAPTENSAKPEKK